MADEDEGEAIPLADLEDDVIVAEKPDEKVPAPAVTARPAPKPTPVPGPKTPAPAPQVGMTDLERQIQDERALRARAMQDNQRLATERDNAIRFAQEAERRGMTTYELFTENQLSSVQEQMEALTGQYEAAMADNDFKTGAQINLKLNKLGGQLAILERDKAALTEQRATMTQQHQRPINPAPAAAPAQPQQPTDPVERAIQNRTPATQQFLRKHTELIRSDGTLKRAAIDAHEAALDAGFAVDTPGYFQHVETTLNGGAQPAGDGSPTHPRQRAPTMAAPVARSANAGAGSGGSDSGTFMVTPKMRRLAEEQGVPIREWVDNYRTLLKAGRITEIR